MSGWTTFGSEDPQKATNKHKPQSLVSLRVAALLGEAATQ